MFDGSTQTFEMLKRPDTVQVIPMVGDKILINRQEQPDDPRKYLSLFGGRVDEGEEILDAAQRELLEESGYEANEYFLWHAEQPVGKIDWAVFTFVAKGLKKVADLDLDAGEKIKLKLVALDELIELSRHENFSEKEIVAKLLEAKNNPKKMEELKRLFNPK